MGEGNYSGTKTELERKHIALVPSGEREDIRQTFVPKGFPGGEPERFVDVITCDEDRWAKPNRCSRFRSTAFGRRSGPTVRITVAGGTSVRCRFDTWNPLAPTRLSE
jgi:hypothetical protein